ncbi:MFS transporter [Thioalkalivibrio sp. HK1]|uniref:MFS transporter n=1 Tax=Thioalkalivibrio sp. HK1 TaxID=1469245 RepID=UPI00046FDDF5|nr:MFS transporter [Thioalkalivibrio sp. HK1]
MTKIKRLLEDRAIFSWTLYDWANSVFATTVIAGFFPVFFKQYWNAGTEAVVSTARLGFITSLSGIIILVAAPLIGILADRRGERKRYLALFTLIGAGATMALWLVDKGQWGQAAAVYVVAATGFSGAIVLYDSLLPAVGSPENYHEVSSLGFSLGYIGGGVLFALNVATTLKPEFFGFSDSVEAVRFSFLLVGIWWLLFSLPLFRHVPEPPRNLRSGLIESDPPKAKAGKKKYSYKEIFHHHRMAGLFLLAYFFYIDAVHTIIRMAVDYGLSIGLPSTSLIVALLITQFVGFPAALAFGWIAHRFGAKPALYTGLAVYTGVIVYARFMSSELEFYILAIMVGLVQGGVQSVSRSLFAHYIPLGRSGEFFGYFNMMGRFAAIIGPALVGAVGLWTGDVRDGILAVLIPLLIGMALIIPLRESAQTERAPSQVQR